MPRLILSSESQPYKLDAGEKKFWICQCGLSKNKPFCDGSHTRTFEEKSDETYFYSNQTQRRMPFNDIDFESLESIPYKEEKVIFSSGVLQVLRLSPLSDYYEKVWQIREQYTERQKAAIFDNWSDIYFLLKNGKANATLRVTQARKGQLDIEKHYPSFLQNPEVRSVLCSTNMLYKSKDADCTKAELITLYQEACKDQFLDGMRLDLINATLPMVRYYRAIGYKVIGETFIHPRTHKESTAMICFVNIHNPCTLLGTTLPLMSNTQEAKLEFAQLQRLVGMPTTEISQVSKQA